MLTKSKHEAQFEKLQAELDLMELELEELEQKKSFCELQYTS